MPAQKSGGLYKSNSHQQISLITSGFVEASPSRDFRDGEGRFVASDITKLMPNVFLRLALLNLISEQRERAVNEMHKFSVRRSDE
ncbi:MAG: hypothetical protein JWN92_2536 [Candidatus Acidoferrum typicum]|nr:hypothetical protein [Candidatus Acidoferrum typicum]